MILGDDFGYQKHDDKSFFRAISKKAFVLTAVLFSLGCFIYITIRAYYFVYHETENGIKIIHSPKEPIKVENKDGDINIKNIDKTIYDSIVGNKDYANDDLRDVKIIKKPSTPIAQKDSLNQKTIKVGDIAPAGSDDIRKTQIIVIEPEKNIQNNERKIDDIFSRESKKPVNNGKAKVQIAALTSEESANNYWKKLNKEYPSLFSGLSHFISKANLGSKGTFYRLQIGNFSDQTRAEEFCEKFIFISKKTKADCIIVE